MKYPKLWNGPSPVGEALVRSLQRAGGPFQRASTAEGVHAASQGGYNEVRQRGGIYTLGYEPQDSGYVIRGTDSWRAPFKRRGEWDAGHFSDLSFPYLGNGYGALLESGGLGSVTIHKSRRGKAYTEFVAFGFSNDSWTTADWEMRAAGRLAPGSGGKWANVVGLFYLHPETYIDNAALLWSIDSGVSWRRLYFSYGAGWSHGKAGVMVTSPSHCFAAVATYIHRRTLSPAQDRYHTNTNPHLSFLMSVDLVSGNAVDVPAGDFLNYVFPDNLDGSEDWVNRDLIRPSCGVFSLSAPNAILAYDTAQFYDRAYLPNGLPAPGNEEALFKVAVFLGTRSGGFGRAATIDLGYPVWPVDGFLVGETPVIAVNPRRVTGTPDRPAALLVGNPGGTSWDIRPLPLDAIRCGIVKPISETRMAFPGYAEGEGGLNPAYRLMVSDDIGLTWRPSTLISRTAPAPQANAVSDGNAVRMPNYTSISFLRDGDFAAPVTPGAPWVSDERKRKPWEA